MPIKPSSTVWIDQLWAGAVFAKLQQYFTDVMTRF